MYVVLDSNVFVADFQMQSAPFQLLIGELISDDSGLSLRLVVPKVVFDEVVNKFRERLQKAASELKKAERELRKLIVHRETALLLDALVSYFEEDFTDTLEKLGAVRLPYPQIGIPIS